MIAVMNFKSFFFALEVEQREAFAQACDTSSGHLRNIAYGKNCNVKLGVAIERESKGVVRVEDVCPDCDWQYVFSDGAALRGALPKEAA